MPPRRSVKSHLSAADARRNRQETSIKLRKNKKEEGLAKRRAISGAAAAVEAAEAVSTPSSGSPPVNVSSIPVFMTMMTTGTPAEQVEGLRGFRRLLSCENSPPVQECIDIGAIPYFIQALQCGDRVDLQFEAAWALTNIASTDRTSEVLEAVPFLVQALYSGCPNVREQAAWCLGNVSGDGPQNRDMVLNAGGLDPLLKNITQPANESLLKNCTWSLSNLARGKPHPAKKHIAPAFPILAQLVKSADREVVVDATWALSYLSDGNDERIASVVESGVVPTLVSLLASGQAQVIVPALRCLGNIVSGSDAQTQAVVDSGALTNLVHLLSHQKKSIRKETCWMLSNIAAGSSEQLAELMRTPGLIAPVLEQLAPSAEWDVRKEAAWVVSNVSTGGTSAHVHKLVEHGAIRPLCDLLDVGDVNILIVALDALDAVLKSAGSAVQSFVDLVDEANGVERVENLQTHESTEVYKRCVKLISTYFGGDDEEDDTENLAPEMTDGATFSFGTGASATSTVFKFGEDAPDVAPIPTGQFSFGGMQAETHTNSVQNVSFGGPISQFSF